MLQTVRGKDASVCVGLKSPGAFGYYLHRICSNSQPGIFESYVGFYKTPKATRNYKSAHSKFICENKQN